MSTEYGALYAYRFAAAHARIQKAELKNPKLRFFREPLLSVAAIVAHGGTLRFVRFPALGATRGLVLEPFLRIEFLFSGGKGEFFAAISASQYFVCHGIIDSFEDSTLKNDN